MRWRNRQRRSVECDLRDSVVTDRQSRARRLLFVRSSASLTSAETTASRREPERVGEPCDELFLRRARHGAVAAEAGDLGVGLGSSVLIGACVALGGSIVSVALGGCAVLPVAALPE
jgi:hypothetical protein